MATLCASRACLPSRTRAPRLLAFHDSPASSKVSRGANKLGAKAKEAAGKAQRAGSRLGEAQRAGSASRSVRGGGTGASGSGGSSKKQPLFQPLGKVPTNRREEGESIFTFVMVAGFLLTGVLFVTIPLFAPGGTSFTKSWQSGVNKTVGIKPAASTSGKPYAPGPRPAAAPESRAAQM